MFEIKLNIKNVAVLISNLFSFEFHKQNKRIEDPKLRFK